ncbi:methionine biosynthesis protein MetW [Agaribacterium haliotis]|uniref:methionine biosynthesis protein MetW n=1 Tax=Agaribacterium haliotis TaxID=2013869 RepID=UPI000BB5591F|nr:methionine biosynthesis protein MetW [Agaribacterium haliotis]
MRLDYSIVANWVANGSQVLDLGCGDGVLLKRLEQEKNTHGYGLEIDPEKILRCVQNDVNVIEFDIEGGLSSFADKRFDTVIMSQAIQTLKRPDQALAEMLRVGRECIITFPNFGHWKARLMLATKGRMPVSDLLPYEWYNTPNIHFCTFKDFDQMCKDIGARVINREVIATNSWGQSLRGMCPNLFGETALYRVSKD